MSRYHLYVPGNVLSLCVSKVVGLHLGRVKRACPYYLQNSRVQQNLPASIARCWFLSFLHIASHILFFLPKSQQLLQAPVKHSPTFTKRLSTACPRDVRVLYTFRVHQVLCDMAFDLGIWPYSYWHICPPAHRPMDSESVWLLGLGSKGSAR